MNPATCPIQRSRAHKSVKPQRDCRTIALMSTKSVEDASLTVRSCFRAILFRQFIHAEPIAADQRIDPTNVEQTKLTRFLVFTLFTLKTGGGEEGKAERDGNVKGKGKEAKRLTGWLFIQNDLEMATAIFCTTRPTNRNRPIAKTSLFFIQFGCSLVWGLILG